ncbi:MAG: DoxX family protein [Anaerolineales bacterium]|nr:DoxX family protein [Anaerolineales bacterium]
MSKLFARFPWLDELDQMIASTMARLGVPFTRIGIGIVFLWFGALKLVPGLSPAEDLVRNTVYFVDPDLFLPVLAVWEMLIGLGMISGKFTRLTILLLFLQMPGTALPLLLLPDAVWTQFPYALTLEGQYIVKNLVIIGSALMIGGQVRKRDRQKTGKE